MSAAGPCTARCHSWYWIRNITRTQHFLNGKARLSLRGIYHCRHCTAKKYGELR